MTCTLTTTKRALFVLLFREENWSTIELMLPNSHTLEVKVAFSINPHLLIPGPLFFIHLLCDLPLNGKVEANKMAFLCYTLFSNPSKNVLTEPVLHKSGTPSFLLNFFLQLPQAHHIRNNFSFGYRSQTSYKFIHSTNRNKVFTVSGPKCLWLHQGLEQAESCSTSVHSE